MKCVKSVHFVHDDFCMIVVTGKSYRNWLQFFKTKKLPMLTRLFSLRSPRRPAIIFALFIVSLFVMPFYGAPDMTIHTLNASANNTDLDLDPGTISDIVECRLRDDGPIIACLINKLLFLPAQLFSVGVSFAVSLLDIFTDPVLYNAQFKSEALYAGWGVVRDLFNIIFIFALLFSAFATIFQIQKYHLRNILKNVIIMALLINFSWPIARVIIDFSNILMFFFLGDGNGLQLAARVSEGKGLHNILLAGADIRQFGSMGNVVLIDIFMFIYMITMLTVAFQFIIRLVALLMLMVFAPIGFAGAAIPRMEGLSSSWWSAFLKYCFAGPVMMFMVVLASFIMVETNKANEGTIFVATKTGAFENFLGNAVAFTVPMAILWGAIIASGKLGDAGSNFVTSKAKSALRRGGDFVTRPVVGVGKGAVGSATGVAKRAGRAFPGVAAGTGIIKGVGNSLAKSSATSKAKFEARQAAVAANTQQQMPGFVGGDSNAVAKYEKTAAIKRSSEFKEAGIGAKVAADQFKNAQGVEKQALMSYMTSKDAVKSGEDLQHVLTALEVDRVKSLEGVTDQAFIDKINSDSQKSALKSLESIDDFAASQFKEGDYKKIASAYSGSDETGKELLSAVNNKLLSKNRLDLQLSHVITDKRQGPAAAAEVVENLTSTQLASNVKVAQVLEDSKDDHYQETLAVVSAINNQVLSTPKSREQFGLRAGAKQKDKLSSVGVKTTV